MKSFLILSFLVCLSLHSTAQVKLNYYLPDSISYNPQIPTPKSVLGYEIGEWHISHDQLVHYLEVLATMSDRITLEEIGRTYENRPLILLRISSPQNHQNLKKIQEDHLQLSNPIASKNFNTQEMPLVVYLGYSVHGNEASGGNAAALVAYYLAAAQGATIEKLLANTVILLDPCFNPDGFQRFSTWVNMHKSKNLISDPYSREFEEVFPNGRTNHYWFDLNRDWLLVQHPESQSRVKKFQEWKPNILTDHHEMGANSTFFFQPGVPSRNNPLTPKENMSLTAEIGQYHAQALDKLGSLYFTKESFDDFYYGKGSTYPDLNGSVGILFEQGSARGKAQETVNGILTFPFSIRNHFTVSLSTLRAAQEMRIKLLDYQRSFYQNIPKESGGYVFGHPTDKAKNYELIKILQMHQIALYTLSQDVKLEGESFFKENAYYVPLDQPQNRLIKALFEKQTKFEDSLFYDISAWTVPLAFNIPYGFTNKITPDKQLNLADFPLGKWIGGESQVGYVFHWSNYFAARSLNRLINKGIITKVSTEKASFKIGEQTIELDYGSIIIPVGLQQCSKDELLQAIKEINFLDGIDVYTLPTGLAIKGIDLGSDDNKTITKPKILLLVGKGISSNEAGEAWHLLDYRFDIPVTLIEQDKLSQMNLSRYNTLIMTSGNFSQVDNVGLENLKNWLRQGNTLICVGSSNQWLTNTNIAKIQYKSISIDDTTRYIPYNERERTRGAQEMGGAIFEAHIDRTHPLCYGYSKKTIPYFKANNLFAKRTLNPYQNPLVYTEKPLISGYISTKNLELLKGSVGVLVNFYGRGQVISFIDSPNFRAFWYGTNPIFLNAIFFGKLISR